MAAVGTDQEERGRRRRAGAVRIRDRWSAVIALALAAAVAGVLLTATVFLLVYLDKSGVNGPEAALSLVFVAAAVVLVLVICTLTIVLRHLRLTTRKEAMGLPSGSIRAVIALMLILLFFIAAIFLFNSTRNPVLDPSQLRKLTGIDAARFAAIPTDTIQSATQRGSGTTAVWDVVLSPLPRNNRTSDDIAHQLITTVGTLVTAVAAFYFGANTVRSAHRDQADLGGSRAAPPTSPGGGSPPAPVDTGTGTSAAAGTGTPVVAGTGTPLVAGPGTSADRARASAAAAAGHADRAAVDETAAGVAADDASEQAVAAEDAAADAADAADDSAEDDAGAVADPSMREGPPAGAGRSGPAG
jgi:hypothetical protein